jgi:hypothetical protein
VDGVAQFWVLYKQVNFTEMNRYKILTSLDRYEVGFLKSVTSEWVGAIFSDVLGDEPALVNMT